MFIPCSRDGISIFLLGGVVGFPLWFMISQFFIVYIPLLGIGIFSTVVLRIIFATIASFPTKLVMIVASPAMPSRFSPWGHGRFFSLA